MEMLFWIGTGLSGLGLIGIAWSVVLVFRARRAGLDDAALRARLNGILPLNLGALFVSMIGLMVVLTGVILN